MDGSGMHTVQALLCKDLLKGRKKGWKPIESENPFWYTLSNFIVYVPVR